MSQLSSNMSSMKDSEKKRAQGQMDKSDILTSLEDVLRQHVNAPNWLQCPDDGKLHKSIILKHGKLVRLLSKLQQNLSFAKGQLKETFTYLLAEREDALCVWFKGDVGHLEGWPYIMTSRLKAMIRAFS